LFYYEHIGTLNSHLKCANACGASVVASVVVVVRAFVQTVYSIHDMFSLCNNQMRTQHERNIECPIREIGKKPKAMFIFPAWTSIPLWYR